MYRYETIVIEQFTRHLLSVKYYYFEFMFTCLACRSQRNPILGDCDWRVHIFLCLVIGDRYYFTCMKHLLLL